jgi:ABC-type Mn2+/Zn2+ transport system permease subunit
VQTIGEGPVLFDTVFATERAAFIHSFMVVGCWRGWRREPVLSSAVGHSLVGCLLACLLTRMGQCMCVYVCVCVCVCLCVCVCVCVWEQCGLDTQDQGLQGR